MLFTIKERDIELYRMSNGRVPFKEWLKKLHPTYSKRIIDRVLRIRDGNLGDYKRLQNGVQELRVHFGAGYRVYFGEIGDTVVLLLCGGDKSTQQEDIKKAVSYWQDYKEDSNEKVD